MHSSRAYDSGEGFFRDLIAVSAVGFAVVDSCGRCIYVNPRFQQMSGQALEHVLTFGWLSVIHPEDRARVAAEWEAGRAGDKGFRSRLRLSGRQGAVRVLAQSSRRFDDAGRPAGWLVAFTDIDDLLGADKPAQASARRVLLVDDDEDFGVMLCLALERQGFTVTLCADPRQALDRFAERPDGWDVMVSDYNMPHLTGVELIARVRALRGDLPCILCTGQAGDFDAATLAKTGIGALLHKTASLSEIVAAVLRVVEKK